MKVMRVVSTDLDNGTNGMLFTSITILQHLNDVMKPLKVARAWVTC